MHAAAHALAHAVLVALYTSGVAWIMFKGQATAMPMGQAPSAHH